MKWVIKDKKYTKNKSFVIRLEKKKTKYEIVPYNHLKCEKNIKDSYHLKINIGINIQNMCINGCASFSVNIVTFICSKLDRILRSYMYCFSNGAMILQIHLLFTKFIMYLSM